MFATPLTITIDGTGHSLTRINQDGYSSEYFTRLAGGGEVRFKIRNVSQKAKGSTPGNSRHSAELKMTRLEGDTLRTYQAYFVFTVPEGGDNVHAAKTLVGTLAFGTLANATAMSNWDN